MAMSDNHSWTTGIAAVAGGSLWAMAKVFAIVFAPTPPSRREVARTFVEAAFSLVAALIGGIYIAPAVVRYYGVQDPETIGLIALAIGLSMWQSVPMLIGALTRTFPLTFFRFFGVAPAQSSPPKVDLGAQDGN